MNKWRTTEAMQVIKQQMDDITEHAVDIVYAEVNERTPVQTGNLKGHNHKKRISALHKQFANNCEYVVAVELGTPPHEIVPVKKKALWWKGARHPVKRVHHPGTDPTSFIRNGIAAAEPKINAMLKRV